jgi:MFS family permease
LTGSYSTAFWLSIACSAFSGIADNGMGTNQQESRADLAVLIFSWLSGDQFLTWGWRIPFLISIIMVGIGLWIPLGILETPVFQGVLDEERVERVPVLQVLKRQPKEIALIALRLPEQVPAYIFGAFVFIYGLTVLGASRDFLLVAVLVSAVLGFLWVTVAGHLSDRIGRKKMYIIGCHPGRLRDPPSRPFDPLYEAGLAALLMVGRSARARRSVTSSSLI